MDEAKILLVDDRPENLLVLEGVLRGDDRRLYKARSGKDALELLMKHSFALAILDVQMPEMDGFELAELMRSSDDTRSIPILFVTAGSRDSQLRFRGFESGAVDFFYKPLNELIVRSKVQVFLDLDRQKRQLQEQVRALECQRLALEESTSSLQASNRELERFAYVASHDIKEPLRAISAYLTLLDRRHGAKLDEESRRFVGYAVAASQRLASLVDALIEHSRIGSAAVQLERTDSGQLMSELLQDLGEMVTQKGATIEIGDLPTVEADRSQLRQLFQNLVTNALKFSDEKAHISVGAERRHGEWVFRVRDNGVGIADADRERIFEPFVRGDAPDEVGGSGIGLSVCKTIVQKHRGRIWVESTPGQGATFYFSLPQRTDGASRTTS